MAYLNPNRSKLLLGCGSAALAMGLAAAPDRASAQAFQATEVIQAGSAIRNPTGTGTETIEVNSPTVVIEWTPFEDGAGNALDFLPTSNVATFQNGPNEPNFAVLNVILPAANGNVTVFDGTVISRLIDGGTGAATPGGTVAFYSPSGIFVGSNAVFDVGNLILTTLEPDSANFDDFAINGGQLQLGGAPTTASIIIAPTAQITASSENSYFAVIAAEVQMFGTADINGSHAYVAGEAVNITVSNGLFDIDIPIGTTVGTPIVLDGDVGGPSSTGAGDNHLIYAVAAAQTDPISMIFRGNLGFAPAASAGIVNGEIILSANYSVNGRTVDGGSITDGINAFFDDNSELTDVAGSIFLEDFASTSSILAIANDEVQVTALNGPSSIDGNLTMVGRNLSELTASNGQTFDITGDVLVSARDFGAIGALDDPADADAAAGLAFIDAFDGGVMTINGNVLVTADAFSGIDDQGSAVLAGSAIGGNATIASNGGSLTINGNAAVSATAFGAALADATDAADVTGGVVQFFATMNGSVVINGSMDLFANAFGSDGSEIVTSVGSDAFSGDAIIQTLSGGSLTVTGNFSASSDAIGGISNNAGQGALADSGIVVITTEGVETIDLQGNVTISANAIGGINAGGVGGDALGGAARAFVPNGGTLLIGGSFQASAIATGGDGIGGGDAFGGIAGAQVITGIIDIVGGASSNTLGTGGNASFGFGGLGGNGEGGNAFLQADGSLTASGTLTIGGNANVTADGRGGTGGNGDGDTIIAGRGGDGIGGHNIANQADPNFGSGAFILGGGDNGFLAVGGTTNATSVAQAGTAGQAASIRMAAMAGMALGDLRKSVRQLWAATCPWAWDS